MTVLILAAMFFFAPAAAAKADHGGGVIGCAAAKPIAGLCVDRLFRP